MIAVDVPSGLVGAVQCALTKTTRYPLQHASETLADLRAGSFEGAAVLVS